MRKELKCIIWAHVGLIVYLLYLSFDLLSLLNDDIFSDALLDVEINPNPSTSLNKPAIIPKIIHQTYKTTDIPEIWKPGQQACINLHQDDYQYFLWTDELAREFINKEFNWFIDTWDNYKYPIQRADAIRYFALYYYGGIYIDLDDGCKRKLDPLLTVPAFVRKTAPTGISNDVMGSVPNHPFFLKVIQDLEKYQRNWLVPYITIMMSTGPLFLSIMWKQYKRWGVPEAGKVRILLPQNYKGTTSSYFAIVRGSSWHMGDANFIKSLGDHLVLAVIGGFLLGLLILFVEYLFYSWVISSQCKRLTSKLLSFTWAILMGVLRFFHLDKLLSKCDFWSRSTKYEEMLLPKDSNDLKNINNNNTSNNNTNGGDSNNNDKSDYNNNDNNNNNINNHTGKTRLSSIFNILGGKTKVKRRNRKDSNLPIEIDVLSKLLDDTVIIDASTTETPTNPVSPTPSPISPTINSRTSNNELLIPTNNNINNNNNTNDNTNNVNNINNRTTCDDQSTLLPYSTRLSSSSSSSSSSPSSSTSSLPSHETIMKLNNDIV